MRRFVSILLALDTAVVGLTSGVTPAHAITKAEEHVGQAYARRGLGFPSVTLRSQAGCERINLPAGVPARSAENTSTSSTITLYNSSSVGLCFGRVVVLDPGQVDVGFVAGQVTRLGQLGAYYYSST